VILGDGGQPSMLVESRPAQAHTVLQAVIDDDLKNLDPADQEASRN